MEQITGMISRSIFKKKPEKDQHQKRIFLRDYDFMCFYVMLLRRNKRLIDYRETNRQADSSQNGNIDRPTSRRNRFQWCRIMMLNWIILYKAHCGSPRQSCDWWAVSFTTFRAAINGWTHECHKHWTMKTTFCYNLKVSKVATDVGLLTKQRYCSSLMVSSVVVSRPYMYDSEPSFHVAKHSRL